MNQSDVVKNEVLKKIVYDKSVKKVNAIDINVIIKKRS